jgi:hypothetical protein
LPEDETKIFDETLEERPDYTNQQMKKRLLRWRPVIDHSMKTVKELAKENSKPIWQHFTANKPIKTKVSRKIPRRKHTQTKKMSDNPLTNMYTRLQKKRSSSRVSPVLKSKQQMNNLISTMYKKLGKKRSFVVIMAVGAVFFYWIVETNEQSIAIITEKWERMLGYEYTGRHHTTANKSLGKQELPGRRSSKEHSSKERSTEKEVENAFEGENMEKDA